MGPSPTYHPPEGEECETSVEHGLPLWAESAVGYCSRRPCPFPTWGSRFVGACDVGRWVGEQKPLGKTPLWDNPSPEMTYLPYLGCMQNCAAIRNDISAASKQHKSSVDDATQTLRSELTSHVTTMHQSSGLTGSYFAPTATPKPKDPRVVTFGVDPTGNPLSPQPSLSHRDACHHDAFNESEVGLESGYPRALALTENPKVHHPYGLPVQAYELSRQT